MKFSSAASGTGAAFHVEWPAEPAFRTIHSHLRFTQLACPNGCVIINSQTHPRIWTWREALVLLFTLSYLIPFAKICLGGGNREFILYLGVMLVLIVAVGWLHSRVRLNLFTLWGLSIWGLAHLAGGLVTIPATWPHEDSLVLYDWWLIPRRLKYDQVIHAYGFGMTTLVCWQGLRRALQSRGADSSPSLGLLTLCFAAGMGFGALNEVVEFIAVLTIPNTNVGGYENTGWDLIFNAIGCLLAIMAIVAIAAWKRA